MPNPILLVKDAGHGETPACPAARFKRGDVVRHKRQNYVVAVAVPPGFPASYALADLLGEARPLMIIKPLAGVSYVLVRENDPKPYLVRERDLRATGETVEIGSIRREAVE